MTRTHWQTKVTALLNESKRCNRNEKFTMDGMTIYLHPNVYSPKLFPELSWYGTHLQGMVTKNQAFLEVGLNAGIVSLHMARLGLRVCGSDINPDAVILTRKNFKANNLKGNFVVSDLFNELNPTTKFDVIFWNHLWQWDESIPNELKSEKTYDPGYRLVERYIVESRRHLTPNGSVFLGSCAYANLNLLSDIAARHSYKLKIEATGEAFLGDQVSETYYIIRLVST